MPSNYTRRISLYINGKEVKNEIASIKAEMNKLVSQQARMTIGSKEYVAAGKQIKQLKGIIAEHNEQLRVTAGGWAGLKKAADGFNRYFAMVTAGIAAASGFVLSIKSMISGNAELSDSLSDVAKTTGLTNKEVKELYSSLGKIDTRTSRKELLDLAYVAGKLGYTSQSDILGFVKAADQIGVALSKDLGGNVEDAVTSLGKLSDIFKTDDQFGIEQALLKTGSAINALGAAGTANEAYIVEFTKRLGGIAPQAGLSIEQVLGLGATLDQLGQQTETSSTAITQLLTKMFKNPAEFAAIAGVKVEEFSKILKTDANEALILFLEGLQKNKGGLTELAAKFGDLGVDGSRAITVIGALSNNTDMLREAQLLANSEFEKGTSLTNEFNLKNENLAGNLERIGKFIRSAFVNSGVNEALAGIVSKVAELTKIPLSATLEEERIKVNVLTGRLLEANTSLGERKKLVTELRSLAPTVVEGIDAESVAYNKLRLNLAEYNKEAMNRVIIQRSQESIDKKNNELLDIAGGRLEKEEILRRQLLKLAEDSAVKLGTKVGAQLLGIVRSGQDIITQAQQVKTLIGQNQSGTFGAKVEGVLDMSHNMNQIIMLREKEAAISDEVNKKFEDRDKLMKEFGVTTEANTKKVEKNTAALDENAGNLDNNLEKLKDPKPVEVLTDAFQELDKQIKSLDTQINNAIASRNTPLIEKLTLEKDAAELLLETYTQVKKAYEAGWNMDQSDLTDLGKMVAKSAGLVVSDKPGGMRKMEDRKFNEDFSGPSQQIQDDEEAAAELRDQISDQVLESAQVLNDSIFAIVRNRQQAEFDNEMSMLEKKRKAELDNKNLSEKEIAAINDKYDKQAAALKLANFKKEQNAAVAMAVVNGALAITKTFAAYGFTPAGIVAAAGQAIATIAEITVIKSQKPPEFFVGGYTSKSGSNNTPVGIVHANEYVVPADGVNNPQVRSVLNTIEMARQAGNLSRLNMRGIMNASGGFKAGGYTSTGTQSPKFEQNNNSGTGDTLLMKALQVIDRLSAKLDQGIEATVAVRGPNGINEKLAEDKETRKNAYL